MPDRIEEYARRSDAMATAVWGGTMRAASGRLLVCAKNQGCFRDSRRLHQTPNAERETSSVPVLSNQRWFTGIRTFGVWRFPFPAMSAFWALSAFPE
jgi:hypothetical protein